MILWSDIHRRYLWWIMIRVGEWWWSAQWTTWNSYYLCCTGKARSV